jgi:diaminopimelate epimerase
MNGSGNDFILIDNRQAVAPPDLTAFVRLVCRRRLSVGADGLILIENATACDFQWQFFNSDGSRAEMCGNGARCAARFAYLQGIAGRQMTFQTDAGLIDAEIMENRAKIKMTRPLDLHIDDPLPLESGTTLISRVNTGVPHVVLTVDAIETLDVVAQGREIRWHPAFAPAGTNVNFVGRQADGAIAVRTYERGVEDETLACGTGAVAAALISAVRHRWQSPIVVHTRSGGRLTIHFRREGNVFEEVYLEGDARIVYTGELHEEALQP